MAKLPPSAEGERVDAAAIADALGVTARAVRQRAASAAWPYTEVAQRGGYRRLYPVAALPQDVRDALVDAAVRAFGAGQAAAAQHLPALPEPVPASLAPMPPGQNQSPDSTHADRLRALARLQVLRAMGKVAEAGDFSTRRAAGELLRRAQAGELPQATLNMLQRACDTRGRSAGQAGRGADAAALPSAVTLQRWAAERAAGSDLVPRPSAAPDLRVRGWYAPFFALADRPQKPTLRWAHEQLLANWQLGWADPAGAPPPSYEQVRAAYAKRSQIDKLKGRHTGSALRAKSFYQHRTYEGLAPGDEIHSDGWNTHFTAPHPVTGEFVSYEVWHFHDCATRYVTPMAIGLTEKADLILEGLQACIRTLGMVAIWQTDHTGSVKGKRVMEEHAGLADRLGISVVHPAEVGNSQANGMAENFNTFLDRESRELATYQHPQRMDSATFVRVRRLTNAMVKAANSPTERAQLRQQAVRAGKGIVFDAHADAVAWLHERAARWNRHACRELPRQRCPMSGRLVHQSPQQALDAARAAGWQPLVLPDEVLADQFRPHYRKKVTRGTVSRAGGLRYRHEALDAHEGEEVLVAVDLDDLAHVWVKDLKGRLIVRANFVAAVGSRTETLREHGDRKRAEARLQRLDRKADDILAGLAPAALENAPQPVLDLALPPLPAQPNRWREPELLAVPLRALPAGHDSWREPELRLPPLRPAAPESAAKDFFHTIEWVQGLEADRAARDAAAAAAAAAQEMEGADEGDASAPEKKEARG